jgi:hypothetical protein
MKTTQEGGKCRRKGHLLIHRWGGGPVHHENLHRIKLPFSKFIPHASLIWGTPTEAGQPQIKAWYRTVATFIAVGGVPADTVGDVPRVVAFLLLFASLLLLASPLWWPFSCCYWSYYRSCYGTNPVGLIIFQLLDYRDIEYRIGASRNYRTIRLRLITLKY